MGAGRTLKVNIHRPILRLFVGGVDKKRDKDEVMAAFSSLTGKFLSAPFSQGFCRTQHRFVRPMGKTVCGWRIQF